MNSLLHLLGTFGQILQNQLFPRLKEELGELSEHHEQFVRALALLQMDGFVAVRHGRGRPAHDRAKVARAFLAKAVFNIPIRERYWLGPRHRSAASMRLGGGGANPR